MKHFFMPMMALTLLSIAKTKAQVGPNLLGAKGTFSSPYVTPNTNAASCTNDGLASYKPSGNIGNALSELSGIGSAQPGSGYTYTSASSGLVAEYSYTLIKNIGDENGGNCVKGDWRGQNHTNDDGWFMAVNGAPDSSKSPIFYKINTISVCAGTKYEFSAWVINMLPASSPSAIPGSEPNISFRVIINGDSSIIANSGPIAYTNTPTWVKVTGQFVVPAFTSSVDLEVVNATIVASGNDLGLDDISLNVVESNITVAGISGAPSSAMCENSSESIQFTVHDTTHTNSWYKWQVSTDGGGIFTDSTAPAQAVFSGDSYSLALNFTNVTTSMSGNKYRLVVSTSSAGLDYPECTYVNEYTLAVTSCGPMPVTLMNFTGKYSNGAVILDWQTSQEINNDRFEIFRSFDGVQFSYIGSVKGAGNTITLSNYTYTDHPDNSAQVYYRLKQIDTDGKAKWTNVVKIEIGDKAISEVYPNPYTSYFTLSFTANKTSDARIVLTNYIGQPVMARTIKTVKGKNSIKISDLSSLPRGMYYATIFNDDINYNIKLQKQ